MQKKILIKNPLILSNDPSFNNQQGSVFIEGQTITHVLTVQEHSRLIELEREAAEVIDATDKILMPGLVNSHYHSYTNLLKGTVNDLPLELWTLYTMAYGHAFEDEDLHDAVLLGSIEMMKSGITSCLDHFPHIAKSESALEAYEKAGMRVAFAPMMHDVQDEQFFGIDYPPSIQKQLPKRLTSSIAEMKCFYEQLIKRWHGRAGRLSIQLGPNAPQRCSDEMLQLCRQLRDEHGLRVHMHLLETITQRSQSEIHYENGMIPYLDELGLLDKNLSVAHAVWLDPEEITLLANRQVSVVHNPASNLLLGSGIAPIPSLLKEGANVAIGTDGSNCGTNQNVFEAMRLAILIHRSNERNFTKWIKAEDLFQMATKSGAHVLGMEGSVGEIRSGQKADLVLMTSETSSWIPLNDPISQLIHQENGASVHSVLINGQWTVQNHKTVNIDEEQVLSRIKKRQRDMFEKCREPLALVQQLRPYFEQVLTQC